VSRDAASQKQLSSLGLRERKKLRTHLAIQRQALRLFRKQGYEATTIEQIAAAAEVSATTFFRYFRSKEDVVLHDALDPVFMAAFEAQPAELSLAAAFRRALHDVYDGLSPEELAEERQRQELIQATPELLAGMLSGLTTAIEQIVAIIARRSGRGSDDIAVVALAGAVIGAGIAVWLTEPSGDIAQYFDRYDAALTQLEAGLQL
jgi:AcrR family transcriptional regulator